jgi:hypothetical protein
MEVIMLKDDKIFFDDGRYQRLLLDNKKQVNNLYNELYEIIFSWKQEYIGERVYDGEKYLIELDINHKKKKYKIQNKFPGNWERFLNIKNRILELCEE